MITTRATQNFNKKTIIHTLNPHANLLKISISHRKVNNNAMSNQCFLKKKNLKYIYNILYLKLKMYNNTKFY